MKCQNCHHTVTRKSKFCPNCGTPIVARKSQHQQQAKTQIHFGYSLALVGLGIVIGLAIFKYAFNSEDKSSPVTSAIQTDQLLQSAVVLDIAREFMCPCGSCSDPLDVCTCDHKNGALEVKSFIAQKLREGHKKPHIVEMVQEQYGALKNESAPLFDLKPPLN
ncbi:MAG: zinc-ribbon domain-containing protein [bacterium]